MIKLPEIFNLEGYTLIVPSVAVANVAQLCVDLIISSLNLEKVGQLWSANFIPIACSNPYEFSSPTLHTTTDFYLSSEKKVILLQIRSPYVGKLNDFFKEIADFVEGRKISKTIILTTSYAYKWTPEHLEQGCPRYLLSDHFPEESILVNLQWKKYDHTSPSGEPERIEGAGFGQPLHKYLSERKLPCVLVYRYCSEGDNISDALSFARRLNDWLGLLETSKNGTPNLKYPPSWCNLFGNAPPVEIY